MTPHLGELIREEIFAELKLPVARVAEILRVHRATLCDLVNGQASLSLAIALRTDKAVGVFPNALPPRAGVARQLRHTP